jgi:tetratricopeptide (TPR) repeat protein
MLCAGRAIFAALLLLLSSASVGLAAEPVGRGDARAVPDSAVAATDSAAAVPDSAALVPEVRERALKARVASHPGDVAPVMDLAQFYYDQGDRSRAEKQYRRALELAPRNGAAMVRLGTVLNESGKSAEALEQFDAALQIEPRRVDTLCRKGQALYALKRQEEAVRLYLEAKQIDPKDQAPYYWLGIAFADAGIYREAITEWTAVVNLNKDSELGRAAAEGIEVLRPMVGVSRP